MRCERAIITAAAISLGLALAACETSSWTDKIQDAIGDINIFGPSKKPLPGERKAVFPEGVPGVSQGVPPELTEGNQANVQPEPPPQAAPPPKKKVAKKAPPKRTPPPAVNQPDPNVWPPPPPAQAPDPNVWPAPPR